MKFIQLIGRHKTITLLIVILILLVIIVIQNSDMVNIRILFWRISAQKIIFIPGAMLFGYLLGKLIEVALSKDS